MAPTCECALLHAESSRIRGCRECGTGCCPTCSHEIDSHTYCRWCAPALQPALTA